MCRLGRPEWHSAWAWHDSKNLAFQIMVKSLTVGLWILEAECSSEALLGLFYESKWSLGFCVGRVEGKLIYPLNAVLSQAREDICQTGLDTSDWPDSIHCCFQRTIFHISKGRWEDPWPSHLSHLRVVFSVIPTNMEPHRKASFHRHLELPGSFTSPWSSHRTRRSWVQQAQAGKRQKLHCLGAGGYVLMASL